MKIPTELVPLIPLVLISIILIFYVYIRVSYGFWYYQPVFHFYDVSYYLFSYGIIQHELPPYDKFTNLQDITSKTFPEIQNSYLFNKFIQFTQSQYLRTSTSHYSPKRHNVMPYFTNHSYQPLFSFHQKDHMLTETKSQKFIPTKKIIGVMTTRPVHVALRTKSPRQEFYAYYVDYLCVHRDYRKQGIAPELIQTHYYRQRRVNKFIQVNLFKREGEITGIMPLCRYTSHLYTLSYEFLYSSLPPNYQVIKCTKTNIHYLTDFIKSQADKFDVTICTHVANIIDLLSSDNYFIYFVMNTLDGEKIEACYVLKDTCVTSQKKSTIACIASICSNSLTKSMFCQGLKMSIASIKRRFDYLLMEEISHNDMLVSSLSLDYTPVITCPMAYFFHNFVHSTILSNKVIIIGT